MFLTFFEVLYDLDGCGGNDPDEVSGKVFVRTGSIHYVFLYKAMEYLAFIYPDEFGVKDEAIGSTNLTVPIPNRSRGDISTRASTYLLDIEIDSPTVFVPANETSKNGFQAEIGSLAVKNSFKLLRGNVHHKFGAMIDQINVHCANLQLYRIVEYSS